MALGLAGYGTYPMVFGDLKPDYADLVDALGGQVITLGRGRGYLNPLDTSIAADAAARLTGEAKRALIADAHGRRLNAVSALLT
ncbi:ATP/GTP-binding protein, partial [Streptomyces sp. DT225]